MEKKFSEDELMDLPIIKFFQEDKVILRKGGKIFGRNGPMRINLSLKKQGVLEIFKLNEDKSYTKATEIVYRPFPIVCDGNETYLYLHNQLFKKEYPSDGCKRIIQLASSSFLGIFFEDDKPVAVSPKFSFQSKKYLKSRSREARTQERKKRKSSSDEESENSDEGSGGEEEDQDELEGKKRAQKKRKSFSSIPIPSSSEGFIRLPTLSIKKVPPNRTSSSTRSLHEDGSTVVGSGIEAATRPALINTAMLASLLTKYEQSVEETLESSSGSQSPEMNDNDLFPMSGEFENSSGSQHDLYYFQDENYQ